MGALNHDRTKWMRTWRNNKVLRRVAPFYTWRSCVLIDTIFIAPHLALGRWWSLLNVNEVFSKKRHHLLQFLVGHSRGTHPRLMGSRITVIDSFPCSEPVPIILFLVYLLLHSIWNGSHIAHFALRDLGRFTRNFRQNMINFKQQCMSTTIACVYFYTQLIK